MTEIQDDGFRVVAHRLRCRLCGGGHANTSCDVTIQWSIARTACNKIFRTEAQQTAVELAIRAELLKLRESSVLSSAVQKISIVYVYYFRLFERHWLQTMLTITFD
jgi:hypothetical protein